MPDAPLTADGERIVEDMVVYCVSGKRVVSYAAADVYPRLVFFLGVKKGYRPDEVYAHVANARRAARKAKAM